MTIKAQPGWQQTAESIGMTSAREPSKSGSHCGVGA